MAGRLTPRTCLLAREGGSVVDFNYRSWGFCWRMNGVIMRFFKLVVGRNTKLADRLIVRDVNDWISRAYVTTRNECTELDLLQ